MGYRWAKRGPWPKKKTPQSLERGVFIGKESTVLSFEIIHMPHSTLCPIYICPQLCPQLTKAHSYVKYSKD